MSANGAGIPGTLRYRLKRRPIPYIKRKDDNAPVCFTGEARFLRPIWPTRNTAGANALPRPGVDPAIRSALRFLKLQYFLDLAKLPANGLNW